MIDPELTSRAQNSLRAGMNCISDGVALAILARDNAECTSDLRQAYDEAEVAVGRLIEMAKHGDEERT